MFFALVFGIDEDVIEVYYYENVEFFYQDLIDIALEYDQCVSQSKRHYLVLKMVVAGFESYLSFIAFPNFYLIVGIGQVELGKTSSLI